MAETYFNTIPAIAGEALEPYRRVKYDGSNANTAVYADASDGDSWIGTTLPGPDGDAIASGGMVTIDLRAENKALKVECSAAVTANASIYPEDDGKVSDDAGTVIIGTAAAASVGAASAAIIAFIPNGGSGSVPTGDSVANSDLDGKGGFGLWFGGTITFTAGAGLTQTLATLSRKMRVIDYFLISRDTNAANIKLNNGTNDMSANVAKGTADDTRVAGTGVIAEYDEVAAAGTIKAISSAECVCDVWVNCVPIE